MGRFKIETPQGKVSWVKSIDTVNETIEFTENRDEAYYRDGGYYTRAEADFIKFHFKERYPEVELITIDGY